MGLFGLRGRFSDLTGVLIPYKINKVRDFYPETATTKDGGDSDVGSEIQGSPYIPA